MYQRAYQAVRLCMVAAVSGEGLVGLRLVPELHEKSSASVHGVIRGRMEARSAAASLNLVRLLDPSNPESSAGVIAGRNLGYADANTLVVRQLSEVF